MKPGDKIRISVIDNHGDTPVDCTAIIISIAEVPAISAITSARDVARRQFAQGALTLLDAGECAKLAHDMVDRILEYAFGTNTGVSRLREMVARDNAPTG